MRFLSIYESAESTPLSGDKMAALQAFTEEMSRAGILVDTGGTLAKGTRVQQAKGKFGVVDGPFVETKELIVGYAIIEVKSRDEAIEMARRFMALAGDGTCEIRQLMSGTDGPHH